MIVYFEWWQWCHIGDSIMQIELGSITSVRIERPTQCSDCTQCLPYSADADGETHCTQDQCKEWETPLRIIIAQKGDLDENITIIECMPHCYVKGELPIDIVEPKA